MSGWIMRDLTKKEEKLFKPFLLGFVAGLLYLPTDWNLIPDEDIVHAYKKNIKPFKRRKERFEEFKSGFINGYFKSISYDGELKKVNPLCNSDIYSYLQTKWLYHHVYHATETPSL